MEDGLYMTESAWHGLPQAGNLNLALLGGVPWINRMVQPYIDHQKAVIKLCMVLSGNPRYANVEAAVRACGLRIDTLYELACADKPLPETFLEALYGPNYAAKRGKTL